LDKYQKKKENAIDWIIVLLKIKLPVHQIFDHIS